MSDGHDHEHDDAADAHDDHGFDGEPAKELSPGEPMTPGWVPLVGAAIFVVGAVFLLVNREAVPAAGTVDAAPAATPQQAPQMPKQIVATALPQRGATPPRAPQPPGSNAPSLKKLTPDEIKDVSKRLQEAQQKRKEAEGAK